MKEIAEKYKQTEISIPLYNWLNVTVSGFLYALMVMHYPVKDINKILIDFKDEKLYPIGKMNNKKANFFKFFANNRFAFILECIIYRIFKSER